ncbi:MAG: phosphatidylinositol-3-phosphatase [Actinomycetota bacterium]|nr:phosphatidylinositol-3-phosphatase [Actinomycetota bacterium]
MIRRALLVTVALSMSVLALPGGPARATSRIEGVPAFGNVFVLVGENTTLSQLTTKDAPYQTSWVRQHSAWFTNYWGISHYSTSNYIAMTSGQFIKCEQLDEKPATCNQDVPNIFQQLDTAGTSWTAWNESMPEPCYLINSGENRFGNSYRVKHNPAVYYESIAGPDFSGAVGSGSCLTHVLPMGGTGVNDTTAFNAMLDSGSVPRFNYVAPNMCEDGHDNCKPQGNPIRQFDDFLAREVPQIMASPAWNASSVIVIVYDEGQDGGPGKAVKFAGGNVPFAVIGGQVHNAVYTGLFNHYSMLRTLEDGLALPGHVGAASTATTLGHIWK